MGVLLMKRALLVVLLTFLASRQPWRSPINRTSFPEFACMSGQTKHAPSSGSPKGSA
jgi:hypothetical protein